MIFHFFRLNLLLILLVLANYVQAQSSTQVAMVHDSKFVSVLREFVKNNQMSGKESGIPVLVIMGRTTSQCEAVLSMFVFMSEFEGHLPNSYVYIDNFVLLIYDGSEFIFRRDKAWYDALRKIISPKLCDNTQVSSKSKVEMAIPCTFKFDPQEKKLIFQEGKLVSTNTYSGQLFD